MRVLGVAQAKDRERESQLASLMAEKARLASQAAGAAQTETLARQLQEQRQENEALHTRMRTMRKKLKVAFEEMVAHNKELRDKLAAAQAQQLRDMELVSELKEARQQVTAAAEQVQKLQADVQTAEARAAEVRELAHSLKAQLDAAETENTRLQLRPRPHRCTSSHAAQGLHPRQVAQNLQGPAGL
ncbi:hypothetical protein GPECTOR_7g1142 [Gonium pectorale]|uniref:Uncharacterized protein n=1 Tax=Gonium pectorale TaxID=33097 RepID=A0A150GU81_GONPE|nr:hypothetical protein GPECTOR_7g1142 [Gonium pectorale]|eukprot:KXZ53248.1 hypothetical protein GPECTOR_7g1142 [Gonium pectorale]